MAASLQRALELTESVHEAIEAGDWLRATELERERRAAIEAFARAPRADDGAAELAASTEPASSTAPASSTEPASSTAPAPAPERATSTEPERALEMLREHSLRMIGVVDDHRRRVLRDAAAAAITRAAVEAYEGT